ncbi:MAG: TonB-dependent receptor plug [Edaphobacter sp.]|nr:TonB-dependent receptor plug [Edaphobacter sp.]
MTWRCRPRSRQYQHPPRRYRCDRHSSTEYERILRLVTFTESVAELKVATLLYGGDSGGTAGAQVDLVSKSGSNTFHGSFFFFRNNWFDAQGPFDPKTPPLNLNDFGASLGGPIIKDKTFFFAVYEGLRQNVSVNLIGAVPTDSFQASVIATSPLLPRLSTPILTGMRSLHWTPITSITRQPPQKQSEDFYLFRIQHTFNAKNSLFVRYNIDQANITGPSGVLRDSRHHRYKSYECDRAIYARLYPEPYQ